MIHRTQQRVAFPVATALLLAHTLAAQSPVPASLRFDVASLKPSAPGFHESTTVRMAPGGQRYIGENASLKLLMIVAYRLKADQISGGPSWMDSERYDMNAQAERQSSVEELHVMLQNLLADRFKLQFHKEKKELPVYVLAVDGAGNPKLQPHEAENAGEPWIDIGGKMLQTTMHAKSVRMDYFTFRLSQMMDRPVVDQTKLNGAYDFDLAFTRELPPNMSENTLINGAPVDTSGPTIFEALRKQLGLRLEAQKAPVDILIVDHAEKPAAN
jgi:uncharacterized protein (TIGR03435 family)